jgi:hypothetical protein
MLCLHACCVCGGVLSLWSSPAAEFLHHVLQLSGSQPSSGICSALCFAACCCMMHSLAIPVHPGCPIGSVRCHRHYYFWEALAYCAHCSTTGTIALFILLFLAACVCWGRTLCVSGDLSEVASPTGGTVACVPDSPVFLVIVSNVVASSDHVTSFFFAHSGQPSLEAFRATQR